MTRIITHQEETHYELSANSESLDFWKTLGFRIKGTGEPEDEFYLRKTCSFGIRQQLGGLAIIQSKGKEGIANRWGCILLACRFQKIELFASDEGEGVQKLHFVGYKEGEMEIYEFDGSKPTKILVLKQLSA